MNFPSKTYPWQRDSYINVIQRCNASSVHEVIPVNASVGSGKTLLAAWAIADFIQKHEDEQTIQVFVTPRIKLCSQQSKEIAEQIDDLGYSYKFIEHGEGESDFQIYPVDCTKHSWDRANSYLEAQHVIFIICDASLWGTCEHDKEKRWNAWMKRFQTWKNEGFIFGNVIFDEAHNFKNNDKVEKIFGQTVFTRNEPIEYKKHKCLMKYFQNIMLLSGTPAAYQKELTKCFKKNECSCTVSNAVREHYVCMPRLNLVKIGMLSAEYMYAAGIIAVMNHEMKHVKPANGVRLLVNFGSIDEIRAFYKDKYIQRSIGKDFHFITLHSSKEFEEDLLMSEVDSKHLVSRIDGVDSNASDVYDLLEGLDSGKTENDKIKKQLKAVLDGKPIIVGQVAMIGEGINIKSFNSVITKSNSHTTAMQQIGRVLRKFKGKTNPNVYCVYDNMETLKQLYIDLLNDENLLTSDCFQWGDKIDLSTGSGADSDEDDYAKKATKINWLPIDEKYDADIFELLRSEDVQRKIYGKQSKQLMENPIMDVIMERIIPMFTRDMMKKISLRIRTADPTAKKIRTTGTSKKEAQQKIGKKGKKAEQQAREMQDDAKFIKNLIDEIKLYWLRHMNDGQIADCFSKHMDAFLPIILTAQAGEALNSIGFAEIPEIRKYIGLK